MNYIVIIGLIFTIFVITIIGLYYWKAKVFKKFNKVELHYLDVEKLSSIERQLLREYAIKELLKEKNKFSISKSGYANYFIAKEIIPDYISYIESKEFSNKISKIIGRNLSLNPFNDKEKLFLKVYYDEKDGMDWHYDKNFSNKSRYTIVIPLIEDDCNTSNLEYINIKSGEIEKALVQEGKAILYEGDKIYHRVTPQTKGCLRISLITVLYDSDEQNWIDNILMNIASIAKNFVNF